MAFRSFSISTVLDNFIGFMQMLLRSYIYKRAYIKIYNIHCTLCYIYPEAEFSNQLRNSIYLLSTLPLLPVTVSCFFYFETLLLNPPVGLIISSVEWWPYFIYFFTSEFIIIIILPGPKLLSSFLPLLIYKP